MLSLSSFNSGFSQGRFVVYLFQCYQNTPHRLHKSLTLVGFCLRRLDGFLVSGLLVSWFRYAALLNHRRFATQPPTLRYSTTNASRLNSTELRWVRPTTRRASHYRSPHEVYIPRTRISPNTACDD
jgi:hypothetical protein